MSIQSNRLEKVYSLGEKETEGKVCCIGVVSF